MGTIRVIQVIVHERYVSVQLPGAQGLNGTSPAEALALMRAMFQRLSMPLPFGLLPEPENEPPKS